VTKKRYFWAFLEDPEKGPKIVDFDDSREPSKNDKTINDR